MVGKIVLGTIAVAGVLAVAAIAPNALQAIDMFSDKKRKYRIAPYVNNTIGKLKERGLIKFEKHNKKIFARLTEKGEQELLKYQLKETAIKKPRKWDKKWRVVIFDIKEKKRLIRDELRRELINLGFIKLQNSIWVHPYECEEVIILLKSYFHFGKDVLYMTVESIENDKWLRQAFGLD